MRLPADGALAYDIEQAAHVCGISTDYLRRAIRAGELRAKRLGKPTPGQPPRGKFLILKKDLEAWLEGLPDDWWGVRF